VEALPRYGQTPSEGLLELDIESSHKELLNTAMNTVQATVKKILIPPQVQTDISVLSHIPPGDTGGGELFRIFKAQMKKLRIRITEKHEADSSGLFSSEGIPALSLGIALGEAEEDRDRIRIDSVEKGRLLLEAFVKAGGVLP
jgi:hypothetical protein